MDDVPEYILLVLFHGLFLCYLIWGVAVVVNTVLVCCGESKEPSWAGNQAALFDDLFGSDNDNNM